MGLGLDIGHLCHALHIRLTHYDFKCTESFLYNPLKYRTVNKRNGSHTPRALFTEDLVNHPTQSPSTSPRGTG
jgi:hypothetical protein